MLWAHWELVAELCDGDVLSWRIARLVWSMLATGMLLALMRELRLGAVPSLLAAALAMWNPYRNEIWTSLTLSEGVAMPYALGGLVVCRPGESRSDARGRGTWRRCSACLAALGCKNTFAAIVPAQLYLRMYADGGSWREGRATARHSRRTAGDDAAVADRALHLLPIELAARAVSADGSHGRTVRAHAECARAGR